MKHSITTILIAVLMSMIGVNVFAHDIAVANSNGVTIYYNWINNNTELSVSYRGSSYSDYSNEYTGSIVIPPSVVYQGNTYSVTSIGSFAFDGCKGLTSVTIPNSVTSIGEYAFLGCDYLTSVTIPNSVTSIRMGTFCACSGLTSVTIPNSVTSIGEQAFSGCGGLTSIAIPNSVTSIDEVAFSGCGGLTSVTIGNSVTYIGHNAFYQCFSLTSVNISDLAAWCNIEFVDNPLNYAHHLYINGNEITNLVIPNSVTSIGYNAFSGCSGLTSVTIPNSVTSIGNYAFYGCSGLTSIVSLNSNPPSVQSSFSDVDKNNCVVWVPKGSVSAYKGADGWKDFANIVEIGSVGYKFEVDGFNYKVGENNTVSVVSKNSNYSGDVIIPNQVSYLGTTYSVTSIGGYAFSHCSGLTSITIPNGVTSIEGLSFYGCSGLTSVNISDLAAWCNIAFEDKDCNPLYYAHHLYINGNEITNLVIPNSVTSIGRYAFLGCSGLTSVTIPNSVTSIGTGAFYGSGLNYVTIPNSVTSIGSLAFKCNNLWGVCSEIENPMEISEVFPDKYQEVDLLVPPGKKSAYLNTAGWVFGHIVEAALIGYVFESGGIRYKIGENNTVSVTSKVEKYSGDVVIPSSVVYQGNTYSVTSIGEDAFRGCSGLISVSIPNSVTSIGDWAFNDCIGLTSVTIPNSVTSIGDRAFNGCIGLTSVTIPNSVTSIGSYAFSNCSGLTSIKVESGNEKYDSRNNCNAIIKTSSNTVIAGCKNTVIPNSVTSIGHYAFEGCSGLTSVTIPNSVTSIGGGAFSGCSGLTSVTIPNSVTSIGDWPFSGCSGLTSVTIPNSVTSIGEEAFDGCTSLTSVTIPNSVTSIDTNAFRNCSSLTTVISEIENPLAIAYYAFGGYKTSDKDIYASATLIVPPGKKSAYQNTDGWKKFQNIEESVGVTVTAISYSIVYGDALPIYGYISTGAALSGTPSISCSATAASPVGTYTITVSKGSVTNKYDSYVNGTLTINKAPLTVTAKNYIIKQGQALPTFEANYSGFKNSETSSVLTTLPSFSCSATSASEPGTYDIIVSGAAAQNYSMSYVKGTLTITADDTSVLLGDANNDGVVDAADIVELVNAKAGHPSASFNLKNADANADGSFTEADITATADIIMKR